MFNNIDSLDRLISVIPIFKASIPSDLSIAVCDTEKFIAYFPGERLNLNIKVGQLLNPDEPLSIALKENKRLQDDVPADFYGYEFTGTALPLHDHNNHLIGGMAVQIRRQTELREIAEQISNSLVQANEQMSYVANGSNQLANFSQELLEQSVQAGEDVKNTDEVLSVIKRVADRTNLLGLNAAIEAARAGERGKGFEVVANEIRKFSQETVDSTKMIRETMSRIQKVTNQMGESVKEVAVIGQEQATSIQQILTFIEEIQEVAATLNKFANKL